MSYAASSMQAVSEHEVVRVMSGNAESIRPRLVSALQQLGWRVISTTPLKAKHGARNAAQYWMSANALEYAATLDINLQPHSTRATQVTFDYRIKHGHLGKGDFRSLNREAEAIIALADAQTTQTHCRSCAAPLAGKTRFCRQCGAPATASLPAEVEVMNLTANARAGYQWTAIGAFILALSNFLALVAFLARGNQRGFLAMVFASIIVSVFGWWSLGAGMRRTHLTLNPRMEDDDEEPNVVATPYFAETPNVAALPASNEMNAVAASSITEHTTALLHEQRAAHSVASEQTVETPARITNSFDQ